MSSDRCVSPRFFSFLTEGRPTLDMGNGESTYDDSRDDFHNNFHHQPPSYAGSSRDHNSNSSHQGFHNQPPSYAESSMDHNSRTLHRSTRIADNYNSLDEVGILILTQKLCTLAYLYRPCLR